VLSKIRLNKEEFYLATCEEALKAKLEEALKVKLEEAGAKVTLK
jgi:hypothetical protein